MSQRSLALIPVLVSGLVAGPAPVQAQGAPASQVQCAGVSGVPFGDPVNVARVGKAHRKLYFVLDPDNERAECPAPGPKCRDSAYLVAGDVVLTLPGQHKGYLCASYADQTGRPTYGWLPAEALVALPDAKTGDKDWLGTWRRTEATVKITRTKGGGLAVSGEATYGAHDPRRVASGAVNSGDLDGEARRTGDVALVAPSGITSFEAAKDECAARMRRIGPYLLVEDNQRCGGMNVSFSGPYARRSTR